MTNEDYSRAYDRSVELWALRKRRKLTKEERAEFALVCEQMFEAQMTAWHEKREREQMPMIVNGTGRIH